MANQYYNKIIINGETKIDLTGDTITAADLKSGIIAHDKTGATITGTNTADSNTQDANAAAAEILKDKTAYVRGSKVTGTMVNNGAVTGTISTKTGQYTVPQGYHDGSGKVSIAASEQAKLIPENIRQNITILGVTGTMSGSEGVVAQAKTATPTFSTQTISPDTGYTHLSEVTINPIPVTEVDNSAGGITVTVG